MIITEYQGRPAKVAVEVNGVFHFSRNSEAPLGKDVIKQKILEKQGYRVLVIPYFHWCILEDAQKPKFLRDVLEKCILTDD